MAFDINRWLDTAVSGIRFSLDREKVRRELEEHIEDKTADLRRIFPDIPEEEARSRALAGMGDPEELRAELARVHKPWLGYLWRASWAALWAVMLIGLLFNTAAGTSYDASIRGRTGTEVYHRVQDGEKAQLGQYTFQITGAAYVDVPEDSVRQDNLQLVLRVTNPRFWERVDVQAVERYLTAVGPDSTVYPMDRQIVNMDAEAGIYQVYTGCRLCKWELWYREFAVCLPAEGWEPGDVVTLTLDSPAGRVELSAPITEKVVVP